MVGLLFAAVPYAVASSEEKKKHELRASDLKRIANPALQSWFKVLSIALKSRGGSEPVVEITDDDCLQYAQTYQNLLSVIREADSFYKQEKSIGHWENSGEVTDSVRKKFRSRLSDAVIGQIGGATPEKIALFEASRTTRLQKYNIRKLEECRARGHKLLQTAEGKSPHTKERKRTAGKPRRRERKVGID